MDNPPDRDGSPGSIGKEVEQVKLTRCIAKHIEAKDSRKRTIELLQSQVLDLTVELNTLTRRIENLTTLLLGYDIDIKRKESK